MATSHKNIVPSDGIHVPYFKVYVDSTARTSDNSLVADDVGKLALQDDDKTLWQLLTIAPTWKSLGEGAGVGYSLTYLNDADRLSATLTSADIGKFARQLNDNTIWMLTADPNTWVNVSNGSNTTISSFYNRPASSFFGGTITTGTVAFLYCFTDKVYLPINAAGSKIATTNNATAVFNIVKTTVADVVTTIGTATFTNAKLSVFSIANATVFDPGDRISVVCDSGSVMPITLAVNLEFVAYNTTNPNVPSINNVANQGRYTFTGSATMMQVPVGCTKMFVKMWGAGGSNGGTYSLGGAGAYCQGTTPVTAGEYLYIVVGGHDGWGYTKGSGGSSSYYNEGGGNSRVIRISDNSAIMVAGGGGSGAEQYQLLNYDGGAGGLVGQDGKGGSYAGKGGTQSAGGAGGSTGGVAGTDISGGSKGMCGCGGGGLFGGGSGGESTSQIGGGGGGGSSLVPSGTATDRFVVDGYYTTPGNSNDPDRGNAGSNNNDGLVIVTFLP